MPGEENVFADILTRWTRGYRKHGLHTTNVCSLICSADQIPPPANKIDWPDVEEFLSAQLNHNRPPHLQGGPDGLFCEGYAIWIPASAAKLKLKIVILSHCGSMGHRGAEATESVVRESFTWDNRSDDIKEFEKGCLQCIITKVGRKDTQATRICTSWERPNEVVHIDFLYMGESVGQKFYILILRDDLSPFAWLWPFATATSDLAAEAVSTRIATFGMMDWQVSDQGSHFKSELMTAVAEELNVRHHFTTAYSPWANGSVERVCREVLWACMAVLHEFRLSPKDWPAVT